VPHPTSSTDPTDGKPFAVSRSKLDLFLECPRCFHLDRRLGVGRPPGFPFNLNTAGALDSQAARFWRVSSSRGVGRP
jgi:hypothetical protein